MKTHATKQTDIKQAWYLVDAKFQTLGRLATNIARILTGKNKPEYSPNIVSGDKVVVINSSKISVSGQKLQDKKYYRHSGYPGGIKEINLSDLLAKKPNEVLYHAVAGMLPKNKLQSKMIKNLKIYPSASHPHKNQKFIEYKLEKSK